MLQTSLFTIAVSLVGGYIFFRAGIPLPWMLGPIVFVNIVRSVWKHTVYWPVSARNAGLVVLGYMMGSSFTYAACRQIGSQLPAMLFSTISMVIFSLGLAWLTSRHTGISLPSSILGSTPGGLTQMVILSEEVENCDNTVVTFLQTIRLLSVVFIVPFIAMHGLAGTGGQPPSAMPISFSTNGDGLLLAGMLFVATLGAFTAHRFHFPTPFLMGPILIIAALVLLGFATPHVPSLLTIVAQLSVGTYMGFTTQPGNLNGWRKILPFALADGIAIVLFSLLIGFFLDKWFHIGLTTAFLSTAPGGMTEMGITAINVGADISTVTAYQIFRLLFILFILPLALRYGLAKTKG